MSTVRIAKIVAFVSALAFSLAATLSATAYACGVNSGGGGLC
ncbi:MAG TPA: hypothetical protein VIP07_08125 [Candidatus Limnocylindria bacterium]|jgi:hypothetical protein